MGMFAPYFLVGLVALAIPIIVHLWSKNTRKSVDFGSLRFLRETETKTMRSIMPSQWLLLLLRMLLIALLVMLLSEPFLERKNDEVETMYLVDTKYADLPWFQSWKDSLKENDRVFWLSEDFPSIDKEPVSAKQDYWKLLQSPPKLNAQNVVVISPLLMNDFKGKKATFPIEYEWVKLPVDPSVKKTLAYQNGGKSFQVNTTFDEWKTIHDLQTISNAEPISVSYFLEVSKEYEVYRKLFESAFLTLNELSVLTITEASNADESDWIFWISTQSPPESAHLLTVDTLSVKKWKMVGANQIHLSADWTMQDAIEQNLPKKLLQLLSPLIQRDLDKRTMDVASFDYQSTAIENINTQESASSLLWILLLVGFIVERWASFKSEKK